MTIVFTKKIENVTRRLVSPFEFFGRSAATRCFSVRAVQLPRCFSCGQGRAAPLLLFVRAVQFFLPFRGNRPLAVPGGWTSPPHCELRTILLTALFRYRSFSANDFFTQLSWFFFLLNFCSAEIYTTFLHKKGWDLFVHCEEFASLFQTFSRNDLPGEAALARGRYVFQKKKEKKKKLKKKKEKEKKKHIVTII